MVCFRTAVVDIHPCVRPSVRPVGSNDDDYHLIASSYGKSLMTVISSPLRRLSSRELSFERHRPRLNRVYALAGMMDFATTVMWRSLQGTVFPLLERLSRSKHPLSHGIDIRPNHIHAYGGVPPSLDVRATITFPARCEERRAVAKHLTFLRFDDG